MSEKKDREITIPVKEIDQIKTIINIALTRILSGKTKKTYQQEVGVISQTIEKYIKTYYISHPDHQKIMIEQIFGYINCFKDLKNSVKGKSDRDKGFQEALDKVISEFESLIYKEK